MVLDIAPVIEGWDYAPNDVTVRKIPGNDGREKIQMRVDLGVLQMELDGRPDGTRPHGYESLLEYHRDRLETHRRERGNDAGFRLSVEECSELREEGVQYYRRYLSLFHLGDYTRVIRDTERNLSLMDFIAEYGSKDWDRINLEQYRPYVLMMRIRSKACLLLAEGRSQEALDGIVETIDKIRDFFESFDKASIFEECTEVVYLRSLADEIVKKLPRDPVEDLRAEMQDAVKREQFERAADLRDRIRKLLSSRR